MATGTSIRLVPLAGWVLVQPRAVVSEVTKAGLIKVDQSGEKPQTGLVLAVGPDVDPAAHPYVQPGLLVLFGKFAGVEVDLGDYEAVLLDVKDLLAGVVLEEADVEEDGDTAEPLIAVAGR